MRKITITILSIIIFLCGVFICQNTFAADSAEKKDANKKVATDSADKKYERSADKDIKLNKKTGKKPYVPKTTYKPMKLGMPGNRSGGSGR